MAWYAQFKRFRSYRRTKYINWIRWYKQHLYDQWFLSLSEEERYKELERQRIIKERKHRDALQSLAAMNAILDVIQRNLDDMKGPRYDNWL